VGAMSVRDVPSSNQQWPPPGICASVGTPWWKSIAGEGQACQDISHTPMAGLTRRRRRVHSFPSAVPRERWIRRGIARYLGPREHVLFVARRHSVVLNSAVAVWLAAVGL